MTFLSPSLSVPTRPGRRSSGADGWGAGIHSFDLHCIGSILFDSTTAHRKFVIISYDNKLDPVNLVELAIESMFLLPSRSARSTSRALTSSIKSGCSELVRIILMIAESICGNIVSDLLSFNGSFLATRQERQ